MKLRLFIAPLVAVVGLVGAQLGAAADTPGPSDTVIFQGRTSTLTPVPLVGGSGSYAFNSSTCAISSDASDGVDAGDPAGMCTIASTGTYVSVVCGTAAVTGNITGSATINAEGFAPYATGNYTISLVAGVGVVTGSGTEADGTGPVTLSGAVQLVPDAPTGDGFCTHGFTVTGSVSLTE